MDEFDRSLKNVLVHEGGFSNHPKDPGGATMKGVTQRVYDTYRKSLGLPTQTVKLITEPELKAIYRREYWDKMEGDTLAPGISYVVFDGSVNSGVTQSVKWLQRALQAMGLYDGKIDGLVGQGTLEALRGVNDNDALVARIIERREAFLRSLKTWKTFGKGWLSRIRGVKQIGQAWATGSVGPTPIYALGGDAKAVLADAKRAPNVGAADAVTGGGAGGVGIAGTLQAAKEQLSPFAGTSSFIDNTVALLVVGGVVVAAGGFAWRWYAKRQRDRLADSLDLQAVPA